jgi:RHS repeat-associated protein
VVTEYLLDVQPGLWNVVAADDGTDVNRYIHDLVTGRILQHEDPSNNWNWPALDGLGTVRQVYDDALAEAYTADRDPYGDLIAATGSNPTPFEYTGEPEDQNGLLHLRARYYDPSRGVFNSRDPLETPNRYAYVGGNPINATDPSGLLTWGDLGIANKVAGCSGVGGFGWGFPSKLGAFFNTGPGFGGNGSQEDDCLRRCLGVGPATDDRLRLCHGVCNPDLATLPTFTNLLVDINDPGVANDLLSTRGCRYFALNVPGVGYPGDQHPGFDFYVPTGSEVQSVAPGIVRAIVEPGDPPLLNASRFAPEDVDSDGQHTVIVQHGPAYTLYSHLGTVDVSEGDLVFAGTRLGSVGFYENSSTTIGPHVHLEVSILTQGQGLGGYLPNGNFDPSLPLEELPKTFLNPYDLFVSGSNAQSVMDSCAQVYNAQQSPPPQHIPSSQPTRCTSRLGPILNEDEDPARPLTFEECEQRLIVPPGYVE